MASLERAVRILEVVASYSEAMTLSQIASKVKLPQSTTHRILGSLQRYHLVQKDDVTRRYQAGYGLLRLAGSVDIETGLRKLVQNHLVVLRDHWNEFVYLCVLVGVQVMCVDALEAFGAERMRFFVRPGRVMPLHAAASAKAVIAFRQFPEITQMLSRYSLKRYTAKTLTRPTSIRNDLKVVRKRGFALCLGEMEVGVDAIAVPIGDAQGKVVASIGMIAPSERLQSHLKSGLIEHMQELARGASIELGCQPSSLLLQALSSKPRRTGLASNLRKSAGKR